MKRNLEFDYEKYVNGKYRRKPILLSLSKKFDLTEFMGKYDLDENQAAILQALCINTARQLLGFLEGCSDDVECIDLDARLGAISTTHNNINIDEYSQEAQDIIKSDFYQQGLEKLRKIKTIWPLSEVLETIECKIYNIFIDYNSESKIGTSTI